MASSGSQGLKKQTPIWMLTIALFAIGVFSAIALVYQQINFAPSFAISNDEAISIALAEADKEPNRDASFLPNEEARAVLVHVTDDGLAFVSDENSLADLRLYSPDFRFSKAYYNEYVWHVDVTTSGDEGSRGYWYLIDANDGQVIGSDRNYAAFDLSRQP